MARAVECAPSCKGHHHAPGSALGWVTPAAPSPWPAPAPVPSRALLTAGPPAAPATGGPTCQRARLWELNGSIHCSVIGTCLSTGELRRVMGRFARHDVSHLDDHALHAEAVGLCGQPGLAAKLLGKQLDARHAGVIRRMDRLRGEAAVLDAWHEARLSGDIPGAYWAVLTHPDTGPSGIRRVFGDVHMLSHLVGAANRADIRRLAALEEERLALLAKVERQQAALREAVTSRDATIRRLSDLAATRPPAPPTPGQALPGEEALATCRQLAAGLQERLADQAARGERLEARLAASAEAAARWERRARAAEARCQALGRELVLLEHHEQPEAAHPAALPAERVLYVGRRPGSTDRMGQALAGAGGELLTHDGGRHDNPSLLAGLVGQADRVLFPVDCVSHEAALAVKRLCRRLGKPFSPLRSAGLASFLAAFGDGTHVPTAVTPDEHGDAGHDRHHAR